MYVYIMRYMEDKTQAWAWNSLVYCVCFAQNAWTEVSFSSKYFQCIFGLGYYNLPCWSPPWGLCMTLHMQSKYQRSRHWTSTLMAAHYMRSDRNFSTGAITSALKRCQALEHSGFQIFTSGEFNWHVDKVLQNRTFCSNWRWCSEQKQRQDQRQGLWDELRS